ncbi:MAG: glycosyltransferase [Anaerolineales bacterium]|nr:glycosyltransferase [Anaerolineales bacterium]
MYIVQMIDGLSFGGAQQLQITFAREAVKRGYKLAVISLSEDDGSPFPRQLEEMGVTVRFFPTTRIFDFDNLYKLTKWMRAERPDVLNAHLTYSYILGSMIGRLTHTPVVATLHSTGVEEQFRVSRTERVEIFALRHAVSKIIACGPSVAKRFAPMVRNKPMVVIPNAVEHSGYRLEPAEREMIRKQISGSVDRPIIISVGRLTLQKGFQDLLDAFLILRQSHPSAFLAIVGGGDFYESLDKRVKDLRLSDHVKLLGMRADVPHLLSASDMYALASHWEGLPIAVLEAMAAGLPVLTTDVGDNAWAIGPAGLTVPPHQPEAFARAMASLLDAPDRVKLGQIARARVEEKFSASVWFDKVVSVYRSVL